MHCNKSLSRIKNIYIRSIYGPTQTPYAHIDMKSVQENLALVSMFLFFFSFLMFRLTILDSLNNRYMAYGVQDDPNF